MNAEPRCEHTTRLKNALLIQCALPADHGNYHYAEATIRQTTHLTTWTST